MAHETLPLKEEKQFIREIKQLKQLREQLSSSLGKQDEVQQALDQKDHIEERSKVVFSHSVYYFLFLSNQYGKRSMLNSSYGSHILRLFHIKAPTHANLVYF